MLCGNRQIAENVKNVSAADSEAIDGSDDRLGNFADQSMQSRNLEQAALGGTIVARFGALLLVSSDAECFLTRPCEANDPDLRIRPGPF